MTLGPAHMIYCDYPGCNNTAIHDGIWPEGWFIGDRAQGEHLDYCPDHDD